MNDVMYRKLFGRSIFSAAACVLLYGCSTIFDAPAGKDALDGVSDKAMSDVQAIAQEQAKGALGQVPSADAIEGMVTGAVQDASQAAGRALDRAAASLNPEKVTRLSKDEGGIPAIFFERIPGQMPQFAILDVGGSSVWLNGKKVEIPADSASHVFLIQPGRHELKVEYPSSPPFEARLTVARHERVTLRVGGVAGTQGKEGK